MSTSHSTQSGNFEQSYFHRVVGQLSKLTAEEKAKEGIYTGKPLNGYQKVAGEEIHQVIEEKRVPIQVIFGLALRGTHSVRELVAKCHQLKLTTYAGEPMTFKSLYNLLTNPFYAGFVRSGGETYPGKHEAIVTPQEFEEVQNVLKIKRY